MSEHTFQCIVVTPEAEIFDQSISYASIPAWDGLVGLAPQRAALLLRLGDGPMRLDLPEGGSRWFFVGGGFAQMKDNRLTLLTDQAIPAEQIVRQEVEQSFKQALEETPLSDDAVGQRHRRLDRARVMMKLAAEHGR